MEGLEIKMVYPEQFHQISDVLFKTVFGQEQTNQHGKIDFACVFYYNNKPCGYVTCSERSSEMLYLQFGGAFPEFRNSRVVYVGYHELIQKLFERYSVLTTRVDNENIPMLKLAFKCGWRINGTVMDINKDLLVELINTRENLSPTDNDQSNNL